MLNHRQLRGVKGKIIVKITKLFSNFFQIQFADDAYLQHMLRIVVSILVDYKLSLVGKITTTPVIFHLDILSARPQDYYWQRESRV